MPNNARILCVADLHAPYMHRDTVKFLKAVDRKYRPTRVVLLGDEIDHHAMSFHDSDPDLLSAGDELEAAIDQLRPLYKLWPRADVIESNHGSMAYRRGKHHGVPRKYLRDYGDVLDAPEGWQWHHDLTLKLPTGNRVYFHHGLSKDIMKVVTRRGVCAVQGHYHTEYHVKYAANPDALLWGLQVSCSIDHKSLAFAYDKTNIERPILGHGIILNGLPKLLPMVLDGRGRWDGTVP